MERSGDIAARDVRRRARSRPLDDLLPFAVGERPDDDVDHVDEPPDPEAAEREQLQQARADLAGVEAMGAEHAEREAEQKRRQDAFLRPGENEAALQNSAVRTHDRHGIDRLATGMAVLRRAFDGITATHVPLLRVGVSRRVRAPFACRAAGRYQAVSRDARRPSRSGSRTGSATFWPTDNAGAVPSVRSRVTKRCPSEMRSISMAMASTACSRRSMRSVDSVDTGGGANRVPRLQMLRAIAIASGKSTKIVPTIVMPVI